MPSEIIAAFLYAQLESLPDIQKRRQEIWNSYHDGFNQLVKAKLISPQVIPAYASNNAHLYYLILPVPGERDELIQSLKSKSIHAVFHYVSLHQSPFYKSKHDGRALPRCDYYANSLVRLPFYYDLHAKDQQQVIDEILTFFS